MDWYRSRALFGKYCWAAALLSAAGSLGGCDAGGGGRPTAHLSGEITIDGQSPPDKAIGTITFRPTPAATGQAGPTTVLITDGKYDCSNVPLGNVTVFIQLVEDTGKTVFEGGRQIPKPENLISEKYNNGIPLDITEDNPNQDFALTSK